MCFLPTLRLESQTLAYLRKTELKDSGISAHPLFLAIEKLTFST